MSRLFRDLHTLITEFITFYFYIKFQISFDSIMRFSTNRDASHEPRDVEPRQKGSSRLNRKYPGNHSRKPSTSTEAKF
jgi:hypothetical protein